MPIYIVTRKSDGTEVYRYEHSEPVEWNGYEFATHDHTALAEAPADTGLVLLQPRRMTKLDFVGLMTQDEFIGLLTLAKSNVAVEAFIKMLDWTTPDPDGTSIDRDDPRTVAGIRAMFSPQRANEILGVA